jgi:hypothetical protein
LLYRSRYIIAKIMEGWALLEEYMGAERKSGSPIYQIWWEQEMDLEEKEGGVKGAL